MSPDLSRRIGLAMATHVVTADERATIDEASTADDVEHFEDMTADARDLLDEIEARATVLERLDKIDAAD